MSWVLTILGIMALIVLHELGHFAVAKAVGMRVERFSLFFPPTIARFRRGETEYALGALPLGGYVKITGMNPEEIDGLDPDVSRRAYYSQSPWKRIAVIVAGPGVNIVIAFVLFWAVLLSGNLAGVGSLNARPVAALSAGEHGRAGSRQGRAGRRRAARRRQDRGDRRGARDGRHRRAARIDAHRCAGTPTNGCRAATPVRLTVKRAGAR